MSTSTTEPRHDPDTAPQDGGGEWDVAVIGVALRVPGADDPATFWQNLREGRESITFFTDDELRAAGYPEEVIADPSYVKATGRLNDVEHFDAAFFGYSPREAETLEPGHRLFLECAWEALEDAGCDPARIPGAVAVFAGAAGTGYSQIHVRGNPRVMAATGEFQLKLNSHADFLATRVAYKLDLRGPAISVQTGCSTGLVAIHLAAQGLLRGEFDVALAGGATVQVPTVGGYMHSPGSILSPDGHCRPFDVRSGGAVGGNGIGVVVLKRLADALRDGDPVRAVVRGSALNNDGAAKVAFSAPGVEGQAAVISEALALAGVEPDTVGYVETHGTATELGDVIEVTALTRAYRASTDRAGFCALGAVKSNVGHLDTAAGVTGFIKAVLAVENGEIPPVVHYTAPNPRIDFAGSPFYVADRLIPWTTDGGPRRAGVSSFGIGGTNAHVIVEEAPRPAPSGPSRPWQLLVLSARSGAAVERAAGRLADHLRQHPEAPLADVAFTLSEGRRAFPHRRIAIVREGEDAAAVLGGAIPERVASGVAEGGSRSVAFLFPGLGDHYPNMARGLYQAEPAFRAEVDRCAAILHPLLGLDIREVLFPGDAPSDAAPSTGGIDLRRMLAKDEPDPAAERLNRTELAQPAVFVIDYALARLWMSWGIVPQAVVGHSLGEYAAAAIAGILSLEDALTLVAERARLIQPLPGGAMLAVSLDPDAVRPYLNEYVSIATVNAPGLSVVAGPDEAVAAVEARLAGAGIVARRLPTTHAFHTPMLRPAADALARIASTVRLRPPRVPMVSNVTGTWITDAQATDPDYWTRHMLGTVRFAEGVGELLREPGRVLLEVGPGQTLGTFVRQRPADDGEAAPAAVIASIRYAYDRRPDQAVLLEALGRLWLAGVTPDWAAFRGGERRRRLHLPTYPWEKQRYWVEPEYEAAEVSPIHHGKHADPADWTYVPTWTRTPAAAPSAETASVLFVHDSSAAGEALASALAGDGVTVARFGAAFGRQGDAFTLRPGDRDDFRALVDALGDARPSRVIYAANDPVAFVLLAAALGSAGVEAKVAAITRSAQEVTGGEAVDARAAAILGACRVVPQEHPTLACRVIDVTDDVAADRVAAEARADAGEQVVALRGRHRWARGFRRARAARPAAVLKEGGVYVFIGGMDGRNGALAHAVAQVPGVRIGIVDSRIPNAGELDFFLRMLTPENPARIAGEAVKAMIDAGVQLHSERADGPGGLSAALRRLEERWGAIDGIIHSLGLEHVGDLAAVAEVRPAAWKLEIEIAEKHLAALREALAGRAPGFVLGESSLAGVLGSFGRVRVAMANALTDACASLAAAEGVRWTSVAWDRWTAGDAPEGDDLWITGAEIRPSLDAALALSDEPNVLVSTGDLDTRIRQSAQVAAGPAAPAQLYARPDDLGTAYEPPSNDLEERIAAVWQALLGVEHVGIHDDFFALGGHSLLATQIIARLKDMFELELPLKVIFEAPTVAKMAVLVEEAILAEIEGLSEDEAAELVG